MTHLISAKNDLTTLFSANAGYHVGSWNDLDKVIHQVLWPLKAEIETLKKTSIEQAAQIMELQTKLKNSNTTKSFASCFSGNSKEQKQERSVLLNAAAKEGRDRKEKEFCVIVAGIPESKATEKETINRDDEANTQSFFNAVGGTDLKIKRVRRFRPSKTPSTDSAARPQPPPLIQVVFESVEDQSRALKVARRHNNEEFKGAYAREDRTDAEQELFQNLNKEKNKKNTELNDHGLLDKPFRFVIHRRTESIRPVDSIKSAAEQKSIFVSESFVKRELQSAKNKTTTPTATAATKAATSAATAPTTTTKAAANGSSLYS